MNWRRLNPICMRSSPCRNQHIRWAQKRQRGSWAGFCAGRAQPAARSAVPGTSSRRSRRLFVSGNDLFSLRPVMDCSCDPHIVGAVAFTTACGDVYDMEYENEDARHPDGDHGRDGVTRCSLPGGYARAIIGRRGTMRHSSTGVGITAPGRISGSSTRSAQRSERRPVDPEWIIAARGIVLQGAPDRASWPFGKNPDRPLVSPNFRLGIIPLTIRVPAAPAAC